MKRFTQLTDELILMLQNGAVGVLRTDTLYGIVCLATNQSSVERVYNIKNRDTSKSPIVLISSTTQLFDTPTAQSSQVLDRVWPGPVSVILPAKRAPTWITRGNKSVAYRLPAENRLKQLLASTGPLIAPSANPESLPPAKTIDQAIAYFGDKLDFSVDGGEVISDQASKLIRVYEDGSSETLR